MILMIKLKMVYPDKHIFLHYVTSPMIAGEIRCTLEVSGVIFADFTNQDALVKYVDGLWRKKYGQLRDPSKDKDLIVGPLHVKDITGDPND